MTEETEKQLKALDDLWKAVIMSDGTPLPDTTRVNVSAGNLRTLLVVANVLAIENQRMKENESA